ncbi:hypothetical protein EVB91_038 [Rhizobium phage RHph_I1_18]|nr:hypothetical protein EVB91_038 [Rhizobium phage RHph_I1_18]
MINDNKPEKSRTSDEVATQINMDDPADIQRGFFRKPSFFADVAITSMYSVFDRAVSTASDYQGWTFAYQSKITDRQFSRLETVATNIAANFPINYEAVRDFLIILCCISSYDDMVKIADAVEIDSLYDQDIVGRPDLILEIPDLYKVAFVANAVDGILKMFSRYLQSQSSAPSTRDNSLSEIFNLLGGGSLGGGALTRLQSAESLTVIGQFMSELLTGKRIPMTMIAKNPNLQSPSYVGQAFLGESPIALPNIDITQTFAKRIASFPVLGNGSGSTMFSFQNSGSLLGSMSIDQLVGRVLFGSDQSMSSTKTSLVNAALNTLNVLTGVVAGETIEPSRADTAIPLLSALSAVQSGMDKQIMPTGVFQEGWKLANSISNHLMKTDNNYLTAFRQLT